MNPSTNPRRSGSRSRRPRNMSVSESFAPSRPEHSPTSPLIAKFKNFNHLSLTSIGSLFSGTSSSKSSGRSEKDDFQHIDAQIALEGDFGQLMPPGSLEPVDDDLTPRPNPSHKGSSMDYYSYCGSGPSQNAIDSTLGNSPALGTSSPHISTVPRFRTTTWATAKSNGTSSDIADAYTSSSTRAMLSGPSDPIAIVSNEAIQDISLDSSWINISPFNSSRDIFSWSSTVDSIPRTEPDTPPLTPDSMSGQRLVSPALTPEPLASVKNPSLAGGDDENLLYTSPHLSEVKEGKKPDRSIDLNGDLNRDPTLLNPGEVGNSPTIGDDDGEWYGLEYTLELSSRERQPSDTQSCTAGEHSKSRESWAAIHQGKIHPFFEDEDYHRWKNWHQRLDDEDEMKRHKKAFEFKSRSKELASIYVEEVRIRDVLCWEKEVYGVVSRGTKDRLRYLMGKRPDIYTPSHLRKYQKATQLRRSRSIGCMRDLRQLEQGGKKRVPKAAKGRK